MDLTEALQRIANRIPSIAGELQTEEATKTSLVMPFIQALGYDIFDPTEVMPEFTADVGLKQGEKVDYAIIENGIPRVLIECKSLACRLDNHDSQLYRYFGTTDARVGVLTDGREYRFFTDLETANRMDKTPFLILRLDSCRPDEIQQLRCLSKEAFDLASLTELARRLKLQSAIRHRLESDLTDPSTDFVRFIADQVYPGRITKQFLERAHPLVRESIDGYISDKVRSRLKTALQASESPTRTGNPSATESDSSRRVSTTADELKGYYIIKAILRDQVDLSRIVMRDVQSYCGILLDDNNRKPICRLRFGDTHKQLGVFDSDKSETRLTIESVEDIFDHADFVRSSLVHALSY